MNITFVTNRESRKVAALWWLCVCHACSPVQVTRHGAAAAISQPVAVAVSTPLPAFGIRLAGADGRRDLSSLSSLVGAGRESAAARAKKIEHVDEALKLVQTYAVGRSDESINVSIVLNVDVKRSDERVRGNVLLPHSNGKTARVAVFARGALADEAREAGADIVGAEDLVSEIVNGRLDFDRTIAAPDVMPILAKAARQLGPKGLMRTQSAVR